jgi:hypothetical protein
MSTDNALPAERLKAFLLIARGMANFRSEIELKNCREIDQKCGTLWHVRFPPLLGGVLNPDFRFCAKMRGELGKKQKFTIAAPGEQCVLKKSLPFIGAKALSAERCVYWSLLRRLTAITNWQRLSIASQPIS